MPQALTVATPRAELAALAWGPVDAPPVLALHGWLDNAASFAALAEHLPGLRIVALDLPGHGRSGHLASGADYPFIEWIATAHAASRALGWDRYALLGHSMGAAISCMLAGTTPTMITRLVAIEGMGPLAEPVDKAPVRLQNALVDVTQHATTAALRNREAAIERFAKARGLTPAQAEPLATRAMTTDDAGELRWASDPRLRATSRWRFSEDGVLAFLRRIACPTLAVTARSGSPFAPRDNSPRLAAVADARLELVDGGHHVHVSDPAAVAAVAGPFLRGDLS